MNGCNVGLLYRHTNTRRHDTGQDPLPVDTDEFTLHNKFHILHEGNISYFCLQEVGGNTTGFGISSSMFGLRA